MAEKLNKDDTLEMRDIKMDFSTISLESDFSSNNNYINFYMNDEPVNFCDIEKEDLSGSKLSKHILVCSPEFNSSIYHFILPLRARYLQKVRPIGK